MHEYIKFLSKQLEIDQPVYRHSESDGTILNTGNYDFKLRIWRRENKPFWFVAVPVKYKGLKENEVKIVGDDMARFGVPLRKARYRNTGKIYYHNITGPDTEFAYEYQFEAVEN